MMMGLVGSARNGCVMTSDGVDLFVVSLGLWEPDFCDGGLEADGMFGALEENLGCVSAIQVKISVCINLPIPMSWLAIVLFMCSICLRTAEPNVTICTISINGHLYTNATTWRRKLTSIKWEHVIASVRRNWTACWWCLMHSHMTI